MKKSLDVETDGKAPTFAVDVPEYEAPELRELGRVEDLTRWDGSVILE